MFTFIREIPGTGAKFVGKYGHPTSRIVPPHPRRVEPRRDRPLHRARPQGCADQEVQNVLNEALQDTFRRRTLEGARNISDTLQNSAMKFLL